MRTHYAVGLDFGTNSVRALVVSLKDGKECGSGVWNYAHGEAGIILESEKPHLARQHPEDYTEGIKQSVECALKEASQNKEFARDSIIGIGVDTTGSTPLPVDDRGEPLAFQAKYENNPHAFAWLWKDHTSHAEAEEITEAAAKLRPHYLKKCGGAYSSEWLWSKLLNCCRAAPEVVKDAHTWVEIADWIPAILTGTSAPAKIKRNICAAGHKAMFNPEWGGYPDVEFLGELDPALAQIRQTLPDQAVDISQAVGGLTEEWAKELGLNPGIAVAAGAFDAHLGAVGSGISPGTLVKIMGTSTCDMMVAPMDTKLPDIPGLCGIVPGSILPDCFGLEAGQSAVGDIYNWFVNHIQPGGPEKGSHEELTEGAELLSPGESGLLGLDWHNGNRTVLVDQRLTGLLIGMNLHTTPSEIYRALIESTAFGARMIMQRFEEYGNEVNEVINCGGIAMKNPLVMQIHADVTGKEMKVAQSSQTCALGAAMAGAVAAGAEAGGYDDFYEAQKNMTGVREKSYKPDPENAKVYNRLFGLYSRLHDIYGRKDYESNLYDVMKELLALSEEQRTGQGK